jgi:hypothetical protein
MANEYNDPIRHIDEAPSNQYNIKASDIDSGVRKTLNTCQYWIKGLPGVCKYWSPGDPGKCTYDKKDNVTKKTIRPSGWKSSRCDFLGRQYNCDKYELGSGGEDLDKYICVATCPYRSGLYRRDHKDDPWRAVRADEVKGYNPDGQFVGQCDGCGGGKGAAGKSTESCSSEEYNRLPVICTYYRPQHIAFGASKPKTTTLTHKKSNVTKEVQSGKYYYIDERDRFDDRLPFSFKVFNLRAKLQKCAYWDADEGTDFVHDSAGLYLDGDDKCINPDEAALPYHTESPTPPPANMLLENVWAEAGCVICNGARQCCPGYTGNWIYCTDERMEKGDKISAQQILELRFWMNNWASQEEYDSVFKRPPNSMDAPTSNIRTYHKWEAISSEPNDSILQGKDVSLCVPNTRQEFSSEAVDVKDIIFINKGTTAPEDPSQIRFPNLIKDVEDLGIPPLYIIYPYVVDDPFDETKYPVCGDGFEHKPCVKRWYDTDGDSVSVVGWTVRNKDMYAFNASITGYGGVSKLRDNYSFLTIVQQSYRDRITFNEAMERFIKTLEEEKGEYLHKATSDENGLYSIGPVDLEYQKENEIVVCFEYNGDWIFRKRTVWSQWHGGAVIQTSFEHKYGDGTYVDDGYHTFTPPATAEGSLVPMEGGNSYGLKTISSSLMAADKSLRWTSVSDFHYNFSYCFKKATEYDVDISRWMRADNAGAIWIEIEDNNLNYIFAWDIDKATAYIEDDDGNVIEEVAMRVKLPAGDHRQANIAPNACVLTPSDGKKCAISPSADWKIKVTYWYYSLSNNNSEEDGVEVVYPDFDDNNFRFTSPTYSIDAADNSFSVSNIVSQSVAVAAFFNDETGRLISVFATKMCVGVARVFCRDVEIKYGWTGNYTKYELEPQRGFLRIDQDGPFRPTGAGSTAAGSRNPCGDHDMGIFSGTGPMWYPYNSCEEVDFYDMWTGANSVVMPHEGVPRYDYRFAGPVSNVPFCSPHSTLYDCAEDWGCGYDTLNTSSVRFTGWARKRGYVNTELYRAMGWSLPRYGNVLREYVERFISIDNFSHISFKSNKPLPSIAWMPLVMDDSCFYISFSCIGATDIEFVNPLNFFVISSDVNESVKLDGDGNSVRSRFEDVFGIRRQILAVYPEPLIEAGGLSYPFVAHYYFKDDSTQWAWQEKWKDIERDSNNSGEQLYFVSLDKPDYIFDMYKEEHRFIAEEGTYDVTFTAPEFDDETGEITRWPSVRLGAGEERWFRILQDKNTPYTYDATSVDWADENEGEVDGSGGTSDGEGNIYEKTTSSSKWIHGVGGTYIDYSNMIYDSAAVKKPEEAENADRIIEVSYDAVLEEGEEYVYNRGIVANIYKNRLKYLPFEEEEKEVEIEQDDFTPPYLSDDIGSQLPGAYSWANESSIKLDVEFDQEVCVNRVVIKGWEGNVAVETGEGEEKITTKYHVQQPSITIKDGDGTTLAERDYIFMTDSERNSGFGLDFWEKDIDLDVSPTRMITNRSKNLTIEFGASVRDNTATSLISIRFYVANYVTKTETVKIWERKYNVSEGSYGSYNLDGPDRVLSFEHNRDNSGIYFNEFIADSSKIDAYNKMRSVHGSKSYEDKEEISVSSYSQVIEAEGTQEELYTEAYESDNRDRTLYKSIVPPNLASIELANRINLNRIQGTSLTMLSEKVKWKNNLYGEKPDTYPLWYPTGYFYTWSSTTRSAKCYLVDDLHDIMQLEFVYVYDNSALRAATGVQSYYGTRYKHLVAKEEKDVVMGGNDITRQSGQQQFGGGYDHFGGSG